MLGDETNSHPIQLVVNYWEIRPSLLGNRLDELIKKGVTHLATFVPWQAVESDISHLLPRFLQAIADRKMTVRLILTPEVGVHYPNSGLPKDLFKKVENQAHHVGDAPIPVSLPPNGFALPSLSSADFTKRYHNFLSRIDALLADLGRTHPHLLDGVTASLSGSYWKYYRAPQLASEPAFNGVAGDYSGNASVVYRQRLEQFYSQREFVTPNPSAANRWKTRNLEPVNRRWFYQQCEDVFRNRSTQFIRKKAASLKVEHLEIYTPEADPAQIYTGFLQAIAGGNADFSRLSNLADAAATRLTQVSGQKCRPFIHWTELGGFRSLSDPQKQFLILKSLLLMGGQGGGLLLDEGEWFGLSPAFRARAEGLSRLIAQKRLKLKTRAFYLAPHLWSGCGTLWDELSTRLGAHARVASSMDALLRDPDSQDAKLLIVDPMTVLTREAVVKILGWVKSGRILALPRSPLYTDASRNELEAEFARDEGMEITLGVSYRLMGMSDGKVVLYDLPEGLTMTGESLSVWQTFLTSLFSLSGIVPFCSVSDGRLKVIPLEKAAGGSAFFVTNASARAVSGDLLFPNEVVVTDLMASLSGQASGLPESRDASAPPTSSQRFSLEVPPCGILPIAADEVGEDAEDRRVAAAHAQALHANAQSAANNELPGFESGGPGGDIQSLWN